MSETREVSSLLVRLDERTKSIKEHVESIEVRLDEKYVTQDSFRPVRIIVYGAVGLVLTAAGSAVVALIIGS